MAGAETAANEILTPEAIDAEVVARTDALQFATEDEIKRCLNGTGTATMLHDYLAAFQENRRIPAAQIRAMTQAKTTVDHNILRAGANKETGVVPRNHLSINAEKLPGQKSVVAWALQSTRVAVLKDQEIPAETSQLHEEAKTILASLEPTETAVLDSLIGQHLGTPLNHLALHAEIEPAVLLESINKINLALQETNVLIHVRNGIAILGGKDGSITIVDNEETRKNLSPKKKEISKEPPEHATIERLQKELAAAQEALAAEKALRIATSEPTTDLQKSEAIRKRAAEAEASLAKTTIQLNEKTRRLAAAELQIRTLTGQLRTLERGSRIGGTDEEEKATPRRRTPEIQAAAILSGLPSTQMITQIGKVPYLLASTLIEDVQGVLTLHRLNTTNGMLVGNVDRLQTALKSLTELNPPVLAKRDELIPYLSDLKRTAIAGSIPRRKVDELIQSLEADLEETP